MMNDCSLTLAQWAYDVDYRTMVNDCGRTLINGLMMM